MEPMDLASPRECYVTAVRKASRRLTQLYDDTLASAGLRSTQYAILSELAARSGEPFTMSELAAALILDRSALGHSVRPLLRDNLISLEKAAGDARVKNVVLTPHGREKVESAHRLWKDAQDRFVSVAGEMEADLLRDLLLRIAHDERMGALSD